MLNGDFYWWVGEVVDRMDPEEIGRCKVRIYMIHNDIEDKDLPWAYPVMPLTTGTTQTPFGPKEGTKVIGFFMDGSESQIPVMFGSIDVGLKND